MASATFDTHAFVKRLTAAGMPVEQAEILADQNRRLVGEQVATKQDIALLRTDLKSRRADLGSPRSEIAGMGQRIVDQLTIRLALVTAAAVTISAALVELL